MLKNAYLDTNNLMFDETVDNNLRYVGANPNNYVSFNNELWRVIGVMNHVSDADGNKESRIKLIRNESIGNYSWDSSPSNINEGLGINEWSESDIKTLLNTSYYSSLANQTCYQGENNITVSCDFSNIGLKDSQSMIETVIWNTGSNDNTTLTYRTILTAQFYEFERGDVVGKQCSSGIYCNDTVQRTTKWTGNIGLIYPSDYGYATKGGDNTSREVCQETYLYNWSTLSDCYSTNYLQKQSNYWTIMPRRDSTLPSASFSVHKEGGVLGGYAKNIMEIYPTIFLKKDIRILDGKGTSIEPFQLAI